MIRFGRSLRFLHLLGFFPPLVALIWQERFALFTGRSPSVKERVILGIVTWLAYTFDGIWDAHKAKGLRALPQRHRFLKKHQRVFLLASAALLVLAGILAGGLSPSHLWAGTISTAAALAYLLLAQAFPRIMRGLIPRELFVGLFFSIAVGLFTLQDWAHDLPPLLAFALLCTANGVAISLDEREVDLERGDVTLATTHGKLGDSLSKILHGGLLGAGLALLLGGVLWKTKPEREAMGESFGLALVCLALVPYLIRDKTLRPAAYDLALCAPLLVW